MIKRLNMFLKYVWYQNQKNLQIEKVMVKTQKWLTEKELRYYIKVYIFYASNNMRKFSEINSINLQETFLICVPHLIK